MNYLIIFILKLLENTFATLRLILVANGKKFIGSILMFIMTLIWAISLSYIVIDFDGDYLKIVVFALGAAVGSLIGSIIEEKIALGTILITFNTDYKNYQLFNNIFDNYQKEIIKFGENNYKFEIICKRKLKNNVIKAIKNNNKNINIIIEKINSF